MAGKLFNLYTLPASFYLEDAPVIVAEGSLFLNCRSEDLSVLLQMKSVSDREISSVIVCLKLFDAKGLPIGEDIQYSYSLLKLKRGDQFGSKKYISVPEKNTRSFSVYVSQVIFTDYSVWDNSKPFIPIGRAVPLELALKDVEIVRQFTDHYGNDCRFMPYTDRDLWFCTCGAVNLISEEKCHSCKRNCTAFRMVNIDALTSEAKERTEREQQEAEQLKAEREKKRKKTKKFLKLAMIILPILTVIALVVATVPPFLARREAYSDAKALLDTQKYEEAQSAFTALGNYLDSEELAQKGVLYEKASYIMSCAAGSDTAALPYAGLSEKDISATDDVGMVLYRKAKELFLELGDYRESQSKISEIDSAISTYNDGMVLDAYNLAFETLEKGEYLKARDEFSALGNYKKAEELKTECIYRRAVAILSFCTENNARDIYVSISDTQGVNSRISMPGSVLTNMGETALNQLKSCFSGDGVDFFYEDTPSDKTLLPICDAVSAEFSILGEYKDSGELAKKAQEAGDFVSEFYSLLREGKLKSALTWLDTYDDEIQDRAEYYEWLSSYISYCDTWELYKGDASLIPYSVGVEKAKAVSFTPRITIEGGLVTMTIASEDGAFTVKLTTGLGETNFQAETEEQTFYYAVINQLDHFTYLRYSSNGSVISSCEYKRAG